MIKEVFEVSKIAPERHYLDVFAKLIEESGELAQEINIKTGFVNKPEGKDGIIGEAVDVIICALDIIYLENSDITEEEITKIVSNKVAKWKKYCQS